MKKGLLGRLLSGTGRTVPLTEPEKEPNIGDIVSIQREPHWYMGNGQYMKMDVKTCQEDRSQAYLPDKSPRPRIKRFKILPAGIAEGETFDFDGYKYQYVGNNCAIILGRIISLSDTPRALQCSPKDFPNPKVGDIAVQEDATWIFKGENTWKQLGRSSSEKENLLAMVEKFTEEEAEKIVGSDVYQEILLNRRGLCAEDMGVEAVDEED